MKRIRKEPEYMIRFLEDLQSGDGLSEDYDELRHKSCLFELIASKLDYDFPKGDSKMGRWILNRHSPKWGDLAIQFMIARIKDKGGAIRCEGCRSCKGIDFSKNQKSDIKIES